MKKREIPGPIVWGCAIAAPLFYALRTAPVDWEFWLLCAASWFVIGGWLWSLRQRHL